MATTNGGWEVVGNKKSKPQKEKATLSKTKKKTLLESMPRRAAVLPVKESPTIYDAFLEEEERLEQKLELERELQKGNKKQTMVGGKKTGQDRKKEPPTLENLIPEMDVEEMQNVLSKVSSAFPANPDVWLKDLASVMNLHLDKVAEIDPVYNGKPLDYPMCLLPRKVHSLLLKTISGLSLPTLECFVDHCIETMFIDLTKGASSHGTRLFVQLLLCHKPEAAIKSLNKYLNLLQKNVARPLRSLSVMWIIGQAGLSNLADGLKVWLTLMLPVLNHRNLSNYVVDYLDHLFQLHPDLRNGFGVMSKADFFRLFSELYADQSNLSTDIRRRLLNLYPKIKIVAWGDFTVNLRNYFSPFLNRCTQDCNESKKSELLNCLVTCLTNDAQSFSVWRQTYNKHMAQSSILLHHLATKLDDLAVNRKMLRETVRAFHLTNEELTSDAHVSKTHDYHLAVTSCKELLTKLNKVVFSWSSVVVLIVLLFLVAFTVDVYSSGSIEKSRTNKMLEEAGVIYFLQHVWNRVCIYSSKIWLWLSANVPVHVSKAWQIISPYCFLVWEKLVQFTAFAAEATKEQRQWLTEKLDSHLPIVLEFLGHYSSTALLWIAAMAGWLCNSIAYYFMALTDWLLQNVFIGSLHPENILAKLSNVLSSVTPYVSSTLNWIVALFGQ